MSRFSGDWLHLREPADTRARSLRLTEQLAEWTRSRTAAAKAPLRIVDLGCGTGANLRFLAPRLPVPQQWSLVDHDPILLRSLRERTTPVTSVDIELRCVEADLASSPLASLIDDADLVTAAALFDLVSAEWVAQLVSAAAQPGRALLAGLTYTGKIAWSIADGFNEAIRRLVNRHQRTDKGFGAALGPDAAQWLVDALSLSGAEVNHDESDWHIGPDQQALQQALLDGWAEAAEAIAPELSEPIRAWHRRHSAACHRNDGVLMVGHRDVLAIWSSGP